MNKYNINLDKCEANYQALTPIRFLQRSADVFPNRTAVIYRDRKYTWAEYSARCHKLALFCPILQARRVPHPLPAQGVSTYAPL